MNSSILMRLILLLIAITGCKILAGKLLENK